VLLHSYIITLHRELQIPTAAKT